MRTIVHCDACINKFGSAARVFIQRRDDIGRKRTEQRKFDLQFKDITLAELCALWKGIMLSDFNSIVYTDSKTIYNAFQGIHTPKNVPQDLLVSLRQFAKEKFLDIKWVERSKNKAGRILEKELNRRNKDRSLKKFGIYDFKQMWNQNIRKK